MPKQFYPGRHWELDADGQPTNIITESRRKSAFITPVPKPKKRRLGDAKKQVELVFPEPEGISTAEQQYEPNTIINEIRGYVDRQRTGQSRSFPHRVETRHRRGQNHGHCHAYGLANDQCRAATGQQEFHARFPNRDAWNYDSWPTLRRATQRPGQLLRTPRAGPGDVASLDSEGCKCLNIMAEGVGFERGQGIFSKSTTPQLPPHHQR